MVVGRSRWLLAAWLGGLAAVFVGERILGAGTGRGVLSGLGSALVIGSVIARGLRVRRAATLPDPGFRLAERQLLVLQALGILVLVLYFLQSDLWKPGGKTLEAQGPKLATILGALWPAVFTLAASALALAELAYAGAGQAARLEVGRIRDAIGTGVGLGSALVFVFAVNYVASERDKKADLSYFRTAKPGESTRKIVRTLGEPVQVAMFFPPANEVREEVVGYFHDLGRESPQLKVAEYDHALEPAKAKELGVWANGSVVFSRGARKEQLPVPLEIESARSDLRRFDREVQKRLLAVARVSHTAYLTGGHDERTRDSAGETDKRGHIRDLHGLLDDQGYGSRGLSAAEGLATEVPKDAGVVMVLGPQKPFMLEEVASLRRYFERGGRLFIALDPESGVDAKDLLAPLGLRYEPKTLCNADIYARKSSQKGDRANIVTGSFSSHPSVGTLGKLGMRAPLILLGAGWFEAVKDKPAELIVDFTAHALPGTWSDANGNFELDAPGETKKTWETAAAVSRKKSGAKAEEEGRAVVVGDSDFLSDGIIPNGGNALFVLDALRWLVGDEAIAGDITSEEDVPIAHTRKQDAAWFYLTTFVAPGAVLGLGFAITRRCRRRPGLSHSLGASPQGRAGGEPGRAALGEAGGNSGAGGGA